MLRGVLIAALSSALIASVGLLVMPARPGPGGALRWTRRLVLALLGTAVLAAAGAAATWWWTDDRRTALVAGCGVVGASLIWLPLTRRWNARAHLCWSTNTLLYVAYLVFMLDWTLRSPLGWAGLVGALMLWVLEVFAGLLGVAYLWELCDALGREHWQRRSRAGIDTGVQPTATPFVSLHVPAHEEPPEMVIATLESLLRIDYPSFEVVAIDDNTEDEALWRPVERWCAEHGVTFAHLADWPGYKSGALNHALEELTDPRAEVIGIVDSDYQIEPDFLTRCAPLFAEDAGLGFVQTPQDYRNWELAAFHRRLYYSYKYFFTVSQPSRNERDGAIFAGTMGLIRRSALEDLGGWDEWCITEDAELSLRLLRAGWSGMHVDTSFGRGVMPLTFEALKDSGSAGASAASRSCACTGARCCPADVGRGTASRRASAGPTCRERSSGTGTSSACSSSSFCSGVRPTSRSAAVSSSASCRRSFSPRSRCWCCSASSGPSPSSGGGPVRPGGTPSAPS